ncbi:MAG: HEAT repeat domain-containing protein [Vicinamibacterales bacterium]
MLSLDALSVALAVEGSLIAIALGALAILRVWLVMRAHQVADGVQRLEPLLHVWLIDNADPHQLVRALRSEHPHVAFHAVARLATAYVTLERQQVLAPILRAEPWVERMLARGRSIFWWRRFDAARLLTIVGAPDDGPLITTLLADRHPAVRLVAIDAAARLGGLLVDHELDGVPRRQDAVQAYQLAALARNPRIVEAALLPRLTMDAPPPELSVWIDAAGALASPAALGRVVTLAGHPEPLVRVHAARALRRHPDPDTVPALLALLADADWRVRAQAARALGALRVRTATDALAVAVRDRSWWVRYRAALALAQIGGHGKDELLAVARGDDPLARDMAVLVSGLSAPAVVEMSEV